MLVTLLTILGLSLFEIISSIDNAVINAEVLGKVSERAKRWFLFWGILFAVFAVRGILPWLIVIFSTGLGPIDSLIVTWKSTPEALLALERAAPLLRIGAGTFMLLLFFHWLFREDKKFGIIGESFIYRHGLWFYAFSSIILTTLIWNTIETNPYMALAVMIGSSVFFITHGFKENAEAVEKRLITEKIKTSDWSKIFYLEAIDTAFSIDGVVGAFAFTLSIPLILAGNGVGAVVVRYLTAHNIETVKKLPYLKNGAMYSILVLGSIMIFESFGVHFKAWLSPISTFVIIGYFLWRSLVEKNKIKI